MVGSDLRTPEMNATSSTTALRPKSCHEFKSVWLQHATHLMSLHMVWRQMGDELESLTERPSVAVAASRLLDLVRWMADASDPEWLGHNFWLWFTPLSVGEWCEFVNIEALLVSQPVFFKDVTLYAKFSLYPDRQLMKVSVSQAYDFKRQALVSLDTWVCCHDIEVEA